MQDISILLPSSYSNRFHLLVLGGTLTPLSGTARFFVTVNRKYCTQDRPRLLLLLFPALVLSYSFLINGLFRCDLSTLLRRFIAIARLSGSGGWCSFHVAIFPELDSVSELLPNAFVGSSGPWNSFIPDESIVQKRSHVSRSIDVGYYNGLFVLQTGDYVSQLARDQSYTICAPLELHNVHSWSYPRRIRFRCFASAKSMLCSIMKWRSSVLRVALSRGDVRI
uniref:Exostosin domain-containing protein n=1 Tax=Heterorhabditis bacteriophora TaxID=37862 RepID=A0A1I7WAW1_HETBA